MEPKQKAEELVEKFSTIQDAIICVEEIIESLPGIYVSDGKTAKNDWNKKVKLFLCSRDIQAGDTFFDNVGRKWENAEECYAKVAREANEKNFEYGKGSYKIIGEISPNAIWVKEGDEFDEEEINKMADLSSTFHDNFEPWIEGRENLGYKCVVFIKGPCGHFH